jgi:hypothetical protein
VLQNKPARMRRMLLSALLQPFAGAPARRLCACGACDAARGAACGTAVQFALQHGVRGVRALTTPPHEHAVAAMLAAAMEQPWQPAMRREAPRMLALLTAAALCAAGSGSADEEEEEEEEEKEEAPDAAAASADGEAAAGSPSEVA